MKLTMKKKFSHSMKLLLLFKVSSSIWKLCCMLGMLNINTNIAFIFFYFWIAVVVFLFKYLITKKKECKTFYVKSLFLIWKKEDFLRNFLGFSIEIHDVPFVSCFLKVVNVFWVCNGSINRFLQNLHMLRCCSHTDIHF